MEQREAGSMTMDEVRDGVEREKMSQAEREASADFDSGQDVYDPSAVRQPQSEMAAGVIPEPGTGGLPDGAAVTTGDGETKEIADPAPKRGRGRPKGSGKAKTPGRRGRAASEVPVGAAARPVKAGNNPWDDPFTTEAIESIEEIDAEKRSIMAKAMNDCRQLEGDKREIFEAAKERGLNTRALKTHLKQRELQRRADGLRDKLEPPIQDMLDLLKQHLGQLDGTPLGEAAVAAASSA